MSNIDELQRLLSISCGPKAEDKEFIRIYCSVGFEPHGIASETWEIIWTLVLPQEQYYWKATDGWRMGRKGLSMVFNGRTFDNVVEKAIRYMKENRS